VTIERLCFRPILGTGKLNEIFISIGLIYLIQNAAAVIWTDEYRIIHSPFESITISVLVSTSVGLPIIITTILILSAYSFSGRHARKGDAGHEPEPEGGHAHGD
jgi:branched-chain amino acid transport system permease protein